MFYSYSLKPEWKLDVIVGILGQGMAFHSKDKQMNDGWQAMVCIAYRAGQVSSSVNVGV